MKIIMFLIATFIINSGCLYAATIWEESFNGDLSNDQANPTPIAFAVDSIQDKVIGTVGGAQPGEFFDDMTFDLFYGFCLESVILVDYVAAGGNLTSGFSIHLGTDSLTNLLANVLIGPANIGQNIYEGLSPFPGDSYTLDIRESTPGQAYEIDFVLCSEAFWNEAFDGDFSNNNQAPTYLAGLPMSDNQISGNIGGTGGKFIDVFSFTVPEGFTGDMVLRAYKASGVNQTSTFNLFAGLNGISGVYIDDVSLGEADVDSNINVVPLPAGNYSVIMQESTDGQLYGIEFTFSDLLFASGFELLVP